MGDRLPDAATRALKALNADARAASKIPLGLGRTQEAVYRAAFLQTAALFYQGDVNRLADRFIGFYGQVVTEFSDRHYDKVEGIIDEFLSSYTERDEITE